MHIYKHHFSRKTKLLENEDAIFYCAANDIYFK